MATRTPRRSKQTPPSSSLDAALEKSVVPAVSRAGAILRLLGKSPEPMGVQAIARALGIIPSTCLHILRTLVVEQLVAVDEASKRYSLGAGVLTLASRWMSQNRFSDIAQPFLQQIASRYGVTAIGVQILGLDHLVVVAIARSDNGFQLHADIGSRFPALISATGRCIAAFGHYDPVEVRKHFKTLRWDVAPKLATWEAEVEQARKQGYAVDRGNYMAGVTVLSAPVFGINNQLASALVIVGISERLQPRVLDAIAASITAQAAEISQRLGRPGGLSPVP